MDDHQFPARPCVGSGFCCKKAPCPYGERDPSTGWCIHLEPWPDSDLPVPRYRCGRYEYIRSQPGWEIMPAFGAGCSSTMFNTDRTRVLVSLRIKTLKESRATESEADELRRLEEFSAAGDEVAALVENVLFRQLFERPALDELQVLDEVTTRLFAKADDDS